MTSRPTGHAISVRTLLVVVGAVVTVTAAIVGLAVAVGLNVPATRTHAGTFIVCLLAVHSAAVLLAVIGVLKDRGVPVASVGIVRPSIRLLHLLWQIPAAVIVVLIVQLIAFAFTGADPVGPSSSSQLAGTLGVGPALIAFASVALVTPVWEELFFRGVIWRFVAERLGALSTVGITAVAFALCHAIPILLPYLVALGLCLAFLRWFHGSIWGSLALHVTINATASSAIIGALFA